MIMNENRKVNILIRKKEEEKLGTKHSLKTMRVKNYETKHIIELSISSETNHHHHRHHHEHHILFNSTKWRKKNNLGNLTHKRGQ